MDGRSPFAIFDARAVVLGPLAFPELRVEFDGPRGPPNGWRVRRPLARGRGPDRFSIPSHSENTLRRSFVREGLVLADVTAFGPDSPGSAPGFVRALNGDERCLAFAI
jgi:hypothetical protein